MPDGGGSLATARAIYKDTVHPIVAAKCSAAGCHATAGVTGMYGFAVPDADASYDQVTALPTLVGAYTPGSAGLLTKIEASHKDVAYSAQDTASITAWLARELEARAGDPSQPPLVDPVATLRAWSGCMSLPNFEAANMAIAWSTLAATNNQACKSCHGSGAFAFMSGAGDAPIFFDTITTQQDLLLKYFTVDASGGVVINTGAMTNAGTAIVGHPRFNPTTNIGMDALQELYDLTVQRQAAAACDPPRLPP